MSVAEIRGQGHSCENEHLVAGIGARAEIRLAHGGQGHAEIRGQGHQASRWASLSDRDRAWASCRCPRLLLG